MTAAAHAHSTGISYFSPGVLVELVGIEPTTYGLQSRRSPS